MTADRVGREPQDDAFAADVLEHARDGFFNASVDRPACLGLLGETFVEELHAAGFLAVRALARPADLHA